MKRLRTSKGISDALATILLLGLVMMGVSVVALLLPRLLPSEPAPSLDLRVGITEYQGDNVLVYTHMGGESVSINNLKVVVSAGDSFYTAEGNALLTSSPTGILGPNENVFISFTSLQIPPSLVGSTVLASLVHKPSGTILASTTIIIPSTGGAEFDFSVSCSPASGTVVKGQSIQVPVTVSLISGATQIVSLSASALSGGSVNFSQPSGNPTFSSTMTISASSTPTGTYTITITGTGGSLTRSCTYTLKVVTRVYIDYVMWTDGSSYTIFSDAGMPTWDLENYGTENYMWKYEEHGSQLELYEVSPGCPSDPNGLNKTWQYDYVDNFGGWAGFFCKFKTPQNMSAYQSLTFWAKCEAGTVSFEVSVEAPNGVIIKKQTFTADTTWWQYSMSLSGLDLTQVDVPFNIAFSHDVTGG